MNNPIKLLAILPFSYTLIKGYLMEGNIDKIDVKREHKELIALFYRMELKAMLQKLMYENSTRTGRAR